MVGGQDLRWNEVGDAGAEALFHVLGSGNRTLKDVRLAGNKVRAELTQGGEGGARQEPVW